MKRLLVTGAGGTLGGYLVRDLAGRGVPFVAWRGARDVDLTDDDALTRAFRGAGPDVVLHAAALARVSDCHRYPDRAFRVNTAVPARLAERCAAAGARLVQVSTDLVFDGERAPYREADVLAPQSVYARSKAEAERAVLARPGNVVARVSLLFGPALTGPPSFFDQQVEALRAGRPITLFQDEWRTPLDLPTAARALVELALADVEGVFHLGGPQRLSRLEMGRLLARHLGADLGLLRAVDRADVPAGEPRPRDTSLVSERWRAAFGHIAWPDMATSLQLAGFFS